MKPCNKMTLWMLFSSRRLRVSMILSLWTILRSGWIWCSLSRCFSLIPLSWPQMNSRRILKTAMPNRRLPKVKTTRCSFASTLRYSSKVTIAENLSKIPKWKMPLCTRLCQIKVTVTFLVAFSTIKKLSSWDALAKQSKSTLTSQSNKRIVWNFNSHACSSSTS